MIISFKKSFFTFIISFLCCTAISAQYTITGIVKDSTNQPIEFANIVLTDAQTSQFKVGTITNKSGFFSINTIEECNCKLTISFVGFQKWTRDIKIESSLDLEEIRLKKSLNKLAEVTVVADATIFERKEDKIVFNVQKSDLKSGFTGVDVLEQSPSVWVDGDNISIRNESARILVNGRKLNLSGAALANYISNIDSDNIKSIEVQTNKDASREAESTGGVINIILLKPLIGYNGNLTSFYTIKGDNYFTNYNKININYGAKKWNVYGNYGYFKNTGSTSSITDISYLETQNFLKTEREASFEGLLYSYTVGFVAQLHKNHEFGMEIFGRNNDRTSNENGDFSLTNNTTIIDDGIVDTDDDFSLKIFNAVANYTWNITKKSSLKVYLDYLNNERSNINNFSSSYNLDFFEDVVERNNADSKAEVIALQTDFSKAYENNLKLDIGAKYTATDRLNNFLAEISDNNTYLINEDRTTAFNYQENILASYISLGKKINDKDYLKIGLRVENTDIDKKNLLDESILKQNYTNFFPSLFYSRDFTNKKSISASYSRSLRRPSFGLLSNDIVKVNDFKFQLGNPDLQPEFIDKFELNYQLKKQSISAYYSKTNDAINGVYFLEGDIAFYKKINSGAQVQYGIDYNRSDKFTKWWSTRFFGNLYNRKFVNEEGEDSFERTTISLRLFNTFKINKTASISLAGIYISPTADAFYEADENYRINLGLRKTFFNKKLTLRVDFNDAFKTLKYRNIRRFDNFETSLIYKPITQTLRFLLIYNFSNKAKISKKQNKSKNEASKRL